MSQKSVFTITRMDIEKEIDLLIKRAIAEDVDHGDITTKACLHTSTEIQGSFQLKQSGVVAGLPLLPRIFQLLDPTIEVNPLVQEGSFQKAGTHIASITGSSSAILTGELVALNILQHASGVATITQEYVSRIAGLKCDIIDTRRTLPGLRALEKYAVAVGGGKSHRYNLADYFVIKSSHLAFLLVGPNHPIDEAVARVKAYNPQLPIEIQIDNAEYIETILKHDFRAIMLRNMTIDELAQCVATIRSVNKKIYLAFSGSVTLETIRALAETGINGVSVSALTHSIADIEMGLRLYQPHKASHADGHKEVIAAKS